MKPVHGLIVLVAGSFFLSGCISSLWTGANLIYDRHQIYKQVDDFQLSADASRALFKDRRLKARDCYVDLTVFNGDLLVSGHVPTPELRQMVQQRLATLTGYRRIFFQISLQSEPGPLVQDSWITTQIRSRIVADSRIDPKAFKVVTSDRIVYVMGDVLPSQANRVIQIARTTAGVKRVVNLLKYYNLSDQPHSV